MILFPLFERAFDLLAGQALGRAGFHAQTALDALFIVNRRQVVLDLSRARRTDLDASHAGDTSDRAVLTDELARKRVLAVDPDIVIVRDELHDALRAGRDAGVAGRALVAVDDRKTVRPHLERIKLAGLHAGSVAEAAETAGLGSAVRV